MISCLQHRGHAALKGEGQRDASLQPCSHPSYPEAHSTSQRGNHCAFALCKGNHRPFAARMGDPCEMQNWLAQPPTASQAAVTPDTADWLSSLMWLQFLCAGMLTMGKLSNPQPTVSPGKGWRLLCTRSPRRAGHTSPGEAVSASRGECLHSLLPVAKAAPNERTLCSYGWDYVRRGASQAAE